MDNWDNISRSVKKEILLLQIAIGRTALRAVEFSVQAYGSSTWQDFLQGKKMKFTTSSHQDQQIWPGRMGESPRNHLDLGEFPFLVTKGAGASCLEPSLNAVQVEDVTTVAPGNRQPWVIWVPGRISLILDARLVKIVAADRACIRADGPAPHRYRAPLFDLESFPRSALAGLGGSCCRSLLLLLLHSLSHLLIVAHYSMLRLAAKLGLNEYYDQFTLYVTRFCNSATLSFRSGQSGMYNKKHLHPTQNTESALHNCETSTVLHIFGLV